MNILPYPLPFSFRFNLYKLTGFQVDDSDTRRLASVYCTKYRTLKKIHEELQAQVEESAFRIGKEVGAPPFGEGETIICIGDSITSDRLSYAKMLGAYLAAHSGGAVIDAGISGDTTSDIINRYYDSVLNLRFDRAVIMIGTNDARGHRNDLSISNTSPEEYKRNLAYLLKLLNEKKVPIHTITIPPVDNTVLRTYFGEEANWHYREETIHSINEIIRELSGNYGAVCVDLASRIEDSGSNVLDEDGLHLSREGHEMLFALILSSIG